MSLAAVFLPTSADAELHHALRQPVAQQAIAAGHGLYLNRSGAYALLPARRKGWFPFAAKLADFLPIDTQEAPECAA